MIFNTKNAMNFILSNTEPVETLGPSMFRFHVRSNGGYFVVTARRLGPVVEGNGVTQYEVLKVVHVKESFADFHHAQNADERGEGVCRTCLCPIWFETGTVGGRELEGWSDRIKSGGDSIVCFKAADYRHVPLTSREAAIYDQAYRKGMEV